MDYRPLVKECIANFGIFLDFLEFLQFGRFFLVYQKNRVSGYIGPPYCGIGATIRIGQEMICLPYARFFFCIFGAIRK